MVMRVVPVHELRYVDSMHFLRAHAVVAFVLAAASSLACSSPLPEKEARCDLRPGKAQCTDIRKFEKASKDVKDPQLKAWIDKTLPHLREHLAKAQALPQAGGKGKTKG